MKIALAFTDPELEHDPKARAWLRHCNKVMNSPDIKKRIDDKVDKARIDLAIYGTATVNISNEEFGRSSIEEQE